MTQKAADKPTQEIWELCVEGRVSLTVTNSQGRPTQISERGKGRRLRLTTEDRLLAQEQVRVGQNDPFTNGMLVRVKAHGDAAPDELSDDELTEIFQLSGSDFENVVRDLSEVNIRRIKAMCGPVDASTSQVKFVEDLIEERFAIGGTTPTYEDMMRDPRT